jgi:hypothetical protein
VAPTLPESLEKNSESNTMAEKSAIEAAAMICSPRGVATSLASASTGTTIPSAVAESMIATNSGASITPAARSTNANTRASTMDRTKPPAALRSSGPLSLSRSISSPARNRRKASPIRASTCSGRSTSTSPRTAGPITMPTTISATTEGSRNEGNRASNSGTAKATAATTSTPVSDISGIMAVPRLLWPQPSTLANSVLSDSARVGWANIPSRRAV